MMKKLLIVIFILSFLFSFSGCSRGTNMPFNGQIEFHEISLEVPERFIRDSTQSTEDLWLFEHDWYSECVIILRSDITGELSAALDDYAEYMREQGADSTVTTFLDRGAVFSEYTRDGIYCQEILFPYGNSFYAVALRGGTASDFEEISATIRLIESDEGETT